MDSWLIDQAIYDYTSDREKRQYIPRSYILQSPPLIVKNANSKIQF